MGGSVALALRALGWHVTGSDVDPARAARGLELGAFDAVGDDPDAEITFVCAPVLAVVDLARTALARGGIVTDIGSVKGPILAPSQASATLVPEPDGLPEFVIV